MKITDKIISKFGADKVLHFCIAGWGVSIASIFGVLGMAIVTFIIVALSVVKEVRFDKFADWNDLKSAVLGMAFSWCFYCLLS